MKGIKRTLRERIAYLRLTSGDTEAFGYFYDQYAPKIYRFIYFKTSEVELAQDITHDVFLKAWEYIMEKKDIDNFQAYLYRMARNKIADHYRQKHRQTTLLRENEAIIKEDDRTEAQAELYILKEHIKNLKEEYQELVILRHVEGLGIDEISQIVEKDKNNVRVTLHRAMTKLKEIYNQEDDTQN